MLTIRNLTKSIGGRVLFEDANMTVNYGEKVVLVGPNGAGKTTLFSVILKTTDSDSGTVERDEWTMTGFLPQESEPIADETIIEVATGRAGELEKLEEAVSAWEEDIESEQAYATVTRTLHNHVLNGVDTFWRDGAP